MKHYSDRHDQAQQLANRVAKQLSNATRLSGKAVLIVAGGSTPALFLNYLSKIEVDWSRVAVIPSDERWVASDHIRSNDRFLRENLKINRASDITIVSLYVEGKTPDTALDELEARIGSIGRGPDACVLGMGEDAHIASLFPGADNLRSALDLSIGKSVMAITAPGADEPRITLTLAVLLSAKQLHLLICGHSKLQTLNRAKQPGDVELMPVRAILGNNTLEIHYAD